MKKKKRRWLIIVLVMSIAGLSFGAYSLFGQNATGHMTVSEVVLQASTLKGQEVAIAGKVVPGSVSFDYNENMARFSLADSEQTINVLHRGFLPDSFKPGVRVAIEGVINPDGQFEALRFRSTSVCNICH